MSSGGGGEYYCVLCMASNQLPPPLERETELSSDCLVRKLSIISPDVDAMNPIELVIMGVMDMVLS